MLQQFCKKGDPFQYNFYWPEFPLYLSQKIFLEMPAEGFIDVKVLDNSTSLKLLFSVSSPDLVKIIVIDIT